MILFLAGSGLSAAAQSADPATADPAAAANASVQLGPVALSPSLQLTNVGYDSNVYGSAESPQSDLTAVASPAVNMWLRLPVARVSARGQLDLIYFRQLTNFRAVDSNNSVRVEVPLRRFTPYVTAVRSVTRNRQNLEVDAPIERLDQTGTAGADLRLTGKMTVGVSAWRSLQRYSGDTIYFGNDLEYLLNRRSAGESAKFRYALTPLTSVGLTAEQQYDRFDSASWRDSSSFWLMPEVEFQPLALVSGRAQVGFRKRSFRNEQSQDFTGTAARVDLRYTLLGRTVFDVGVQRDLAYSYRLEHEEYIVSGTRVGVTHRLTDPLDVGFNVWRYGLNYKFVDSAVSDLAETFFGFGAGVGYRVGRSRVGVQVEYSKRTSESPLLLGRHYDRLRVTSSLSHDF